MDNWDDLRFVVALARYGSMANAARHLRTNTATVSRRIKRLNESANATLFQKGATEWELTAEGRRLYDLASNFGDDLRAFEADADQSDRPIQTIRVSALEFLHSTVLTKRLNEFHKEHDNISLELSATEKNVSLAFGEADIALRLSRPTEGRLVARRIADIRMGVFGRKGSNSKKWIGLAQEFDWTPEMKNGVAFYGNQPTIRLSSFAAILQGMKETGMNGIGPELMAREYEGIVPFQPREEMRIRELWMLYHETRKPDVGIQNTSKWIEDAFSSV